MPRLATFYGIAIYLYTREHGVAHFHAFYAEHEAVVSIESGLIIDGRLPRRQAALVAEWWELHQLELKRAWAAASSGESAGTIEPLP